MTSARTWLLAVALAAGGAAAQTAPDPIVAAAKARFAPDSRTAVFDVTAERDGKRLVLRGKVHDATLRQQVVAFAKSEHTGEVVDELQALPAAALGAAVHGVVSVSVANLRSRPGHDQEMATQALLGMPVSVLDRDGDWFLVQTPNHYLAWTDDRIVRMDAAQFTAWQRSPRLVVTATFAVVRSGAGADADPVADVVAGGILGLDGDDAAHWRVRFPDGRQGLLPRAAGQPLADWLAHADATPERLVATARRFLGVPYLWGGTSTKGMDCSGFTSTVYLLNGVVLPRDASQQVLAGEVVPFGDGFSTVQPGDLLFFGRAATAARPARVTHVALSLGGARFIHASVDVRKNSLDPQDPDFSAALRKSLLQIRRLAGGQGAAKLADLPYYRAR